MKCQRRTEKRDSAGTSSRHDPYNEQKYSLTRPLLVQGKAAHSSVVVVVVVVAIVVVVVVVMVDSTRIVAALVRVRVRLFFSLSSSSRYSRYD
jgi:hypothetical protein